MSSLGDERRLVLVAMGCILLCCHILLTCSNPLLFLLFSRFSGWNLGRSWLKAEKVMYHHDYMLWFLLPQKFPMPFWSHSTWHVLAELTTSSLLKWLFLMHQNVLQIFTSILSFETWFGTGGSIFVILMVRNYDFVWN